MYVAYAVYWMNGATTLILGDPKHPNSPLLLRFGSSFMTSERLTFCTQVKMSNITFGRNNPQTRRGQDHLSHFN